MDPADMTLQTSNKQLKINAWVKCDSETSFRHRHADDEHLAGGGISPDWAMFGVALRDSGAEIQKSAS